MLKEDPVRGDPSRKYHDPIDPADTFFVVGVGASAGGLEALERMFQAMPEDTGMAFVIVQHLSPDFKSLMDELLARHTGMPIHRVEDGMRVQPNSLYLIPPKQEMIISDGRLLLTEKDSTQSLSLPIDHFFRSLAQDLGRRSIAVVLSGTGSDGSRGIRDVHDAGGLVIAQSTETAKFDGMPKSAIDTGFVDVVEDPSDIPEILRRYGLHPVRSQLELDKQAAVDESSIAHVFRLLQQRHKIDFNYYKPTTIGRRIQRRIQLNHHGDIDEYVLRLEDDPAEVDQLYKDLLIGVTRFFRDRHAFDALRNEVLPKLLLAHDKNSELRAWVAGCATGEEAYSLAILVDECLREVDLRIPVKIFATDVHRASLDFAHAGVYPEASLEEMTSARRDRYFLQTDAGFQVLPEIRKMIVFAPHNLVKDAPFTRLHLITCRNLLIYLRTMAQKKVVSLFHFGLNAGGVLFMGASESPGDLAEEFETLNERWKIFRKRRDVRLSTDIRGAFEYQPASYRETRPASRTIPASQRELIGTYDELLEQFMPPGILLDERREVIQMFGGAGRFLKLRDGRLSTSLLTLVDDDLKLALTGALQRVTKTKVPVTFERVRIDSDAGPHHVRLQVLPVGKRTAEERFLITFQELDQPSDAAEVASESLDLGRLSQDRVQDLELELRYSKENLQAAIEELETSNEELQATNEELVASNEELQSTNEELHSVNEELYTVNAEYQRKIAELTVLTNDMDSLLESTRVHTLFLDRQLCIRKFTPQIARVFNLINTDVGRRIDGFTHKLACEDLLDKLVQVLDAGGLIEEEVRDSDGRDYQMRILPYLSNNQPEGAVLTLIDITQQRAAEKELNASMLRFGQERNRLQSVLDQSLCIIYLKDHEGRYVELNQFAADNMGRPRNTIIGRTDIEILGPGGMASHEADMRVISRGERVSQELVFSTPCGERAFYALKSPLKDPDGKTVGTCGVSVDMTERKEAEALLARELSRRDEFLAMLSHELRNPMGAVLNALQVLGSRQPSTAVSEDALGVIQRQTRHMARLLDDLLDVARIGQSKIEFRKEVFDLGELADDVLDSVSYELAAKQQTLHATICRGPLLVHADPARIKQAQLNLLTNASKYTPEKGEIWYDLERDAAEAVITVRDSGQGISRELLDCIFDLFVQSETNLDRSSGGMGVGLWLARTIVEAHAGTIHAESEGSGRGSRFRIQLPLTDQPRKLPPPPSHIRVRGHRLLLVEDNEDARTMLATTMELEGFTVEAAGDGETALARFRDFQPDVAVIDIGLPVMDGYQLAQGIRNLDVQRQTLLIALTGYGRESDRQAALDAGFDAHLVKPLDPTALYALIADRQHATRAVQQSS